VLGFKTMQREMALPFQLAYRYYYGIIKGANKNKIPL
jgi:hypothetical protein